MRFHVGQQVVCIDDTYPNMARFNAKDWPQRIKKGTVYTVREVRPNYAKNIHGDMDDNILFHELKNPLINWGSPWGICEAGFAAWRFRPMIEKKTDISIFEKMLTGTKGKKGVSIDG